MKMLLAEARSGLQDAEQAEKDCGQDHNKINDCFHRPSPFLSIPR